MKTWLRSLIGAAILAAWVALFFYCAHTHSGPIIDRLANHQGLDRVLAMPEVFVTWSWTNLFLLSLLASMAGELARNSGGSLSGAAARGFFVFLATISGQILFSGSQQFHFPSQDDYMRVAGSLSLLSFMVGYNPSFFINMMRRFETVGQPSEASSNKPASTSPSKPAHSES